MKDASDKGTPAKNPENNTDLNLLKEQRQQYIQKSSARESFTPKNMSPERERPETRTLSSTRSLTDAQPAAMKLVD